MEISRKNNWTKEEESTLINEIESAGEVLRGSENSADINKKKRQLWKDIVTKINKVDDIRKSGKLMPVLEKQERLAWAQIPLVCC